MWYLSPRFLKKKSDGDIAIAFARPSVTRLLLYHWTKSNQIWCVCWSHEWGVQRHIFVPPPGEVPKGQILLNIFKFQLKSQFQRLLNQTLCVYSQMNDIKHIRQDFHSAAWVMPQGWDLGVPWGVGGVNKIFSEISTRVGVWVTYTNGTCNGTIFLGPAPLWPWRKTKRSNIVKSQLLCQFQRFLNQTLCVFSQMKDIKHIRRDFH